MVLRLSAVSACRTVAPPPPIADALTHLWPAPERNRDLFRGIGGQSPAPGPSASCRLPEVSQGEFSESLTVEAAGWNKRNVKFPPDAATEVFASRILWAVGYHHLPLTSGRGLP
jgi:hypothetical protein